MNQTDSAIARGVAYLQSVQTDDGNFITQVSVDRSFVPVHDLPTIFGPALILIALSRLDTAQPIRRKLATWLFAQKNSDHSFNYWAKGAAERQTRPYPNDLDDTCCAWIGLYLHDPQLLDSTALAHIVRLLLATEQKVGGPYKTWLVERSASAKWHDVDLAVNANIEYLLQLVAEPLPSIQQMMGQAIKNKKYQSPYYPKPLVVLYYFARAYRGERRAELIKQILAKQKAGHWQTPAQTALAISALRYLGEEQFSSETRAYLLKCQQKDGSWPAEPIWLDAKHGGQNRYAGSAALTTAFVLESLAPSKKVPTSGSVVPDRVMRSVVAYAQKHLVKLDEPLRQQSKTFLTKLAQSSSGREIALLPQLFAQALTRTPWLPNVFYARLGAANIFGWMAYTIYDDFLDDEGDPRKLPVANVAMRESLASFRLALPQEFFLDRVQQTFTRIDAANAWEVVHCRFENDGKTVFIKKLPHFKNVVFLAERSVGHCLAPLAVLAANGFKLDDPRVTLFEKGFRHYLAARQLNDDLHDWQDDFARGQISYVVAHLLRAINCRTGRRQSTAQLSSQLQRQFWQTSLPRLCQTITRQIRLSRQAYAQSQLFTNQNQFLELLDTLEDSMVHTLAERQKAVQFLEAYKK